MSGVDFSLYETGGILVIAPSGRLDASSTEALGAQVQSLVDRNRPVVLDLLRVVSLSDEAVQRILAIDSDLRGSGSEMALLCASEEVLEKLAPWRNLLRIQPSLASLLSNGFQDRGFRWSRRTGFRLSPQVAVVLAVILAGWMGTLMVLVLWQFRALQTEGGELERLRGAQARAEQQIRDYEARLKPLADLGLLDMPRGRGPRHKPTGPDSAR